MQLEVKLLKVLELIHNQKLNVLNKKEILYTDLHNIYSKVDDMYSIVSNNRHKPEFHLINGEFRGVNNTTIKGEQ
jgi:hypothetical protein